MLNISAFTFNYDHLEDRILLIGNLSNGQQRIDFWCTRKLVLRLLKGSQELLEKTSGEIAEAPAEHRLPLAQFHNDSAQQSLQTEQQNQAVTASAAMLLCRLDISYQKGQYRILFFSEDESEPVASSVLSYSELHQVLYLLHKGAQVLDWGVADVIFDSRSSSQVLQ